MEPEILHIPELAKLMGRTEAAIRSAVQTRPDWLPPPFKQGARLCWRLASVRRYIEQYESGEHRPVKAGRPRKQPPTLSIA